MNTDTNTYHITPGCLRASGKNIFVGLDLYKTILPKKQILLATKLYKLTYSQIYVNMHYELDNMNKIEFIHKN